jgi:predicted secreted Zn-dependent protease
MKQRDILFRLIIFGVCLLASTCSKETSDIESLKPNISERYVYYNIGGATANELRHQMDQFGPSDEFGARHDAYTAWYVEWHYPNLVTNDKCTIGSVTVTVSITQTLPKWETPPEAPPGLIKQWDTYIEALQRHENGHREIGIAAGEKILRALSDLPSYPTCGELEQIADREGQGILDEYRRKEIDYDRTTNHGELQDARFP